MSSVSLQELGVDNEPANGGNSAEPQMLPVTRYQRTVVLLSSFMAVFLTIGITLLY
jgi:hypothetical protein